MGDVKRYTRAEVAERTGRGGAPLWMVVKDIVYDVTSFVNEHPGGTDVITDNAGKDATRDFEDTGHSADARALLTKFKIGEIVDEEKHYDANGKKIKKAKVVNSKPEADYKIINSKEEKHYDANGKKIKKAKVVNSEPKDGCANCWAYELTHLCGHLLCCLVKN